MLIAILALGLQVQAAASKPQKLPVKTDTASRCVSVGESPDARVSEKNAISPGPAPLLSFRYYEGKLHHRFNNMDLMLDDAGH
jgi:hypothetical protein